MASVSHLLYDAENIISEIESRFEAAEENIVENFKRARLIQKIFRGHITRKHVQLLHKKATTIQKNWRAFVGRIIYRKILKEKFEEMCQAYYCKMATTIQRCWRGYWIRANVFSYHQLRSWLGFVSQQSKILKSLAAGNQNKNNVIEMEQREEEAKEWIVYILFKLHHLLRTRQISGIYSLPNTSELSEIEKLLKCLKYKDFMVFYNAYLEDLRQERAKKVPPYIFQRCKTGAHFEKEYYEHKMPHKNFMLSREPYKSPYNEIQDMELRELSLKRYKKNSASMRYECSNI